MVYFTKAVAYKYNKKKSMREMKRLTRTCSPTINFFVKSRALISMYHLFKEKMEKGIPSTFVCLFRTVDIFGHFGYVLSFCNAKIIN